MSRCRRQWPDPHRRDQKRPAMAVQCHERHRQISRRNPTAWRWRRSTPKIRTGKRFSPPQNSCWKISGTPMRNRSLLPKSATVRKSSAPESATATAIVPPEVLPDDPKTAQLITDIIATVGSKPDASGKPGVDAELLEKFITAAKDHLDWIHQGKLESGKESSPVMVWGRKRPRELTPSLPRSGISSTSFSTSAPWFRWTPTPPSGSP